MKKRLAFDIGNTRISLGVFEANELVATGSIATNRLKDVAQLERWFKRTGVSPKEVEAAIVSSVVPEATQLLQRALRQSVGKRVWVVGKDIQVPIQNKTKAPEQVGQDRLVNAYAAFQQVGGPAIVVDFGTAVTVDVISGSGAYLGGTIVPGMEISMKALARRAALLPRLNLEPPRQVLGVDTQSAMQSGLFYGFAALCDGLIQSLSKELEIRPKVIATGGYASLLKPYTKRVKQVAPALTLEGLAALLDDKLTS